MSATLEGTLEADGSAEADAHPTVTVDLSNAVERWRYSCPNGHDGKAWSPTNNHVFCHSCRRQMDNGSDISPEHFELYDKVEDRTVPFSAFEFENA